MKILRVNDDTCFLYNLIPWLDEHDLGTGDRFGISWKQGKRRKLRSYRIQSRSGWECECCGWVSYLHLTKGKVNICLDNHFGISYFGIRG